MPGDYDEKPKAKAEPKVAPKVTPTPKPSPKPAPGQKAQSWVHPRAGTGPQLVGNVFFKTKDSAIDTHDRGLLAELATAYGGNRQRAVKGSFEGFADPRPSHEPHNAELSSARASTVGSELFRAFAATGAWYENVGAHGRGVDPAASQVVAEPGFEDVLAPYRRVDIYLEGEPNAAVTPQRADGPEPAKVPDYSDRPRYREERFGIQIERGDKETIDGVAANIQGLTDGGIDGQLGEYLFFSGVPLPVKPPWWDGRIPAPVHGRGGYQHDRRPEYVRRAMQLVRDYQLYVNYLDDRRGDFHTWFNSGFKDPSKIPDGYGIQARLGHLRFMIDAIGSEATEVRRLVK